MRITKLFVTENKQCPGFHDRHKRNVIMISDLYLWNNPGIILI